MRVGGDAKAGVKFVNIGAGELLTVHASQTTWGPGTPVRSLFPPRATAAALAVAKCPMMTSACDMRQSSPKTVTLCASWP